MMRDLSAFTMMSRQPKQAEKPARMVSKNTAVP
jgi:hypothetical protein